MTNHFSWFSHQSVGERRDPLNTLQFRGEHGKPRDSISVRYRAIITSVVKLLIVP